MCWIPRCQDRDQPSLYPSASVASARCCSKTTRVVRGVLFWKWKCARSLIRSLIGTVPRCLMHDQACLCMMVVMMVITSRVMITAATLLDDALVVMMMMQVSTTNKKMVIVVMMTITMILIMITNRTVSEVTISALACYLFGQQL